MADVADYDSVGVVISSLLITDSDFQPMPPERAVEGGDWYLMINEVCYV